MTSRHYSSDAKEVNILIAVRCFKMVVKLGVFKIAICGKKVRCSFNSFEQCMLRIGIRISSRGDSGTRPQHMILWRTYR